MNKLPDTIFGIDTEDAYKRLLERKKSKEEPKQEPIVHIPTSIEDPNDYIIINSRDHGDYHSPDLLVQIHKLSYTPEVEQASKALGYNISNTSEESDKTPYIGNIDHKKALSLNQRLGNITLTPINFTDLVYRLIQAIKGNETILYGDGKTQVPKEILEYMFNEMLEVRNPYRAEWLDARFEERNDYLYVHYNHIVQQDGSLIPKNTEKLKDFLKEDCFVDLSSFNSQGLPTKKSSNKNYSQGENLYYYHPRNETVARLYADSGGAILYCNWSPSILSARLEVRAKFFSNHK